MAGSEGVLRVALERARDSDLAESKDVAISAEEDSLGRTYLARDIAAELDNSKEIALELFGSSEESGDSLRRPPGPWGDDDVLRLVVADTGPGVSEEAISRIFDPFYTTRSGGTGLGLAIVQRIVQAHRGVITVQTRAGRGTRFAVWLPVRRFLDVLDSDADEGDAVTIEVPIAEDVHTDEGIQAVHDSDIGGRHE
jgi:signal transduction histidine kinase